MIQANELRIGNWIHFTNSMGKEMNLKIDVFLLAYMVEADPDFVHHGYGIKYEGNIKGIRLTPVLLEKCGFVRVEHVEISNKFFQISIGKITELIINPASDNSWLLRKNSSGVELGQPIKYLHQLQNLYFALTGSELEVNL
jgi:hypothetical protein